MSVVLKWRRYYFALLVFLSGAQSESSRIGLIGATVLQTKITSNQNQNQNQI